MVPLWSIVFISTLESLAFNHTSAKNIYQILEQHFVSIYSTLYHVPKVTGHICKLVELVFKSIIVVISSQRPKYISLMATSVWSVSVVGLALSAFTQKCKGGRGFLRVNLYLQLSGEGVYMVCNVIFSVMEMLWSWKHLTPETQTHVYFADKRWLVRLALRLFLKMSSLQPRKLGVMEICQNKEGAIVYWYLR